MSRKAIRVEAALTIDGIDLSQQSITVYQGYRILGKMEAFIESMNFLLFGDDIELICDKLPLESKYVEVILDFSKYELGDIKTYKGWLSGDLSNQGEDWRFDALLAARFNFIIDNE